MDSPKTEKHLREKIAKLRADRSQEEIADQLGIPRSTYRNWENGTRKIKAADIVALSNVFGVSADELLGIPEKSTGLSAEAAAQIKAWSKDRYVVSGLTRHSEVTHLCPSTFETFEKMIECDQFECFLLCLSGVGARVKLELALSELNEEYESQSFSDHVGFSIFQFMKQAECLAKTMYSVDQEMQHLEELEATDGEYSED